MKKFFSIQHGSKYFTNRLFRFYVSFFFHLRFYFRNFIVSDENFSWFAPRSYSFRIWDFFDKPMKHIPNISKMLRLKKCWHRIQIGKTRRYGLSKSDTDIWVNKWNVAGSRVRGNKSRPYQSNTTTRTKTRKTQRSKKQNGGKKETKG